LRHSVNNKAEKGIWKSIFWISYIFIIVYSTNVTAQNDTIIRRDIDTTISPTNLNDTIHISLGDSVLQSTLPQTNATKKSAINSKVEYSATDSISLDLENQKVYMYKDADIKYERIKQKAAYIMIDFNTSILTALPKTDSTGKKYGMPEFSEGDQAFRSEEMRYNFRSKRGFIRNVITQEGEGYLHGEVVKKMDNDVSNMRGGAFTTCNLDHPHFALRFTKAKVIPNNKIVTGPAFMTIEDVPIPIILPFGLFPNKKGQTSGVLIPTYGESRDRGFYLNDGGYYFGINEYMELKIIGDIYSRGSWALKPTFNYKKRYKYTGGFSFNYAINTSGVRETENFNKTKDFRVRWDHRQDPKARPNSQFNANVNIQSTTYNRFNPASREDLLTNQFNSSISYSTSLWERVSLTASLTHSQNTSTRTVNFSLPDVNVSVNRFYPFRTPGKTSNLKWYDNISMNYTAKITNQIQTEDSLMFTKNMLKDFRNGVEHNIPVNLNLKVLKYFSLNNSITYKERWYTASINKTWINDTIFEDGDTTIGYVKVDTISGLKASREYSMSSGLSTTVYGMLQFRKGPVRALRHVINPSVSINYRPDFGREELGYYRDVQVDTTGRISRYSIFGNDEHYRALFGVPSIGESGSLNFSISNNLEMKVRSKSDTITGMKKVMLIDNFTIRSTYDLAKDTLKWSPLALDARTTLFKKIQINYTAVFDPYVKDAKGVTINKFEWDVNNRLFRKERASWRLSLSYSFSPGKNKTTSKEKTAVVPEEEAEDLVNTADSYVNWNNPWNFSFNYSLAYNQNLRYSPVSTERKLIQTLGFNGDVNVTPKWKVNFTSGYDFQASKLSYTSVSIYRDLHCWEMRFNWIPLGPQRSWNFFIKVKAGILQDLKLNRKKDFRDN